VEGALETLALAYTIEAASRMAAVSKSFLYAEIGRGHLVARKSGRRTLVLPDELEAWLRALPTAPRRSEAA